MPPVEIRSARRLRCIIAPLALLISISLGSMQGCRNSGRPAWASLDPDNWSDRSQRDEPIIFDLEGTVAVDVETFAGDVTIEADPRFVRGEVVIVREGAYGFGRTKEAKASLSDITVAADIVAGDLNRGQLGQALRVRVQSASPEHYLQRAHVHIKAPEISSVVVRSAEGDVKVWHVDGEIDIEASNGQTSVRTNLPITSPVTIINRDGDVDFRAGRGSAGDIDAQTVNGRVKADIRHGSVRIESATRDDLFKASVNDGQNRIILRTTRGDVRIAVLDENERSIILPSRRADDDDDDDDDDDPESSAPADGEDSD